MKNRVQVWCECDQQSTGSILNLLGNASCLQKSTTPGSSWAWSVVGPSLQRLGPTTASPGLTMLVFLFSHFWLCLNAYKKGKL
jgi:hypothetical protein